MPGSCVKPAASNAPSTLGPPPIPVMSSTSPSMHPHCIRTAPTTPFRLHLTAIAVPGALDAAGARRGGGDAVCLCLRSPRPLHSDRGGGGGRQRGPGAGHQVGGCSGGVWRVQWAGCGGCSGWVAERWVGGYVPTAACLPAGCVLGCPSDGASFAFLNPPLPCPACSATLGGGLFIICVIFSVVVLVPKAGEDSGEPAEITVRRLPARLPVCLPVLGWLPVWGCGRVAGQVAEAACLLASLAELPVQSMLLAPPLPPLLLLCCCSNLVLLRDRRAAPPAPHRCRTGARLCVMRWRMC